MDKAITKHKTAESGTKTVAVSLTEALVMASGMNGLKSGIERGDVKVKLDDK